MEGLHHGDCLEVMKDIPDGSIDMVLTDPPYQITACKWDSMIDLEPMWAQLKRIIKPNGAIVLFGVEPFSSQLRTSGIGIYKQDLVWLKTRPSNFMNAKKMFMNWHENVIVFYRKPPTFNRQMVAGEERAEAIRKVDRGSSVFGSTGEKDGYVFNNGGLKNPTTVLKFSNSNKKSLHPTQKPVALMEYLIKTYTNENETVLDFTMGSGTTGVACKNLGRKFLGIEMDSEYFEIAKNRIHHTVKGD